MLNKIKFISQTLVKGKLTKTWKITLWGKEYDMKSYHQNGKLIGVDVLHGDILHGTWFVECVLDNEKLKEGEQKVYANLWVIKIGRGYYNIAALWKEVEKEKASLFTKEKDTWTLVKALRNLGFVTEIEKL